MKLANEVRPHTFDEVVGQKEIVANIRQQSIRNKFFQGYTLCGQFGSGKTTIARIIQLAVNCHHKDQNGNPCLECDSCKTILAGACSDIVEIDAASNTGVDSIRSLKEEVQYLPSVLDKKVYIIDEVQRLSAGAFDALLKVLEEPPAHVVFVLCTTEKNKIPKTILSRTAVYSFGCICSEDIVAHLEKVCNRYDIGYEKEGLALIARNSQGAMRNALSILEQTSQVGAVSVKAVSEMLGVADSTVVSEILDMMLSRNEQETVSRVMKLLDGGIEAASMISDMLDMLADCIVASYGGRISGTAEYAAQVRSLSGKYKAGLLSATVKELLGLREKYRELPDRSTVICGIISAFHGVDLYERVKLLEKAMKELALTSREALSGANSCKEAIRREMDTQVTDVKEADLTEAVEECVEEQTAAREKSAEPEEHVSAESMHKFPVGSVVMLDGRKFRVDEYRAANAVRTDVVLFDLTATEESGYPISRLELLSVFEQKAELYEQPCSDTQKPASEEKAEIEPAAVKAEKMEKSTDNSGEKKTASADEFFAETEDEAPFEEEEPEEVKKPADDGADLFAMFGIESFSGTAEPEEVKKPVDVEEESVSESSLYEEMEKSPVLKAAVEFGCEVKEGKVFCREKKEEPVGRILNAFMGAGKLTETIHFA